MYNVNFVYICKNNCVMITDDFISRVEAILRQYGLSTSAFADKIGVQRSGISHLLSGRNKPSLDFILKIINVWPEIDIDWLLTGKGNLLREDAALPDPSHQIKESAKILKAANTTDRETSKIVVFYTDGTFTEHLPAKN